MDKLETSSKGLWDVYESARSRTNMAMIQKPSMIGKTIEAIERTVRTFSLANDLATSPSSNVVTGNKLTCFLSAVNLWHISRAFIRESASRLMFISPVKSKHTLIMFF